MMTNPISFYLEFFHITLKVVYHSLEAQKFLLYGLSQYF